MLSVRSPHACEFAGGDGFEAARGHVGSARRSLSPQQVMVLSVRSPQLWEPAGGRRP